MAKIEHVRNKKGELISPITTAEAIENLKTINQQSLVGPGNIEIPKGDKGDLGPTPDIQIGTVTTAEPGTPASASVAGTPEAPLLNLVIPKGAKGDQGNPGSSQDYPFELINNETTDDPEKGHTAAGAKRLNEKIEQVKNELDGDRKFLPDLIEERFEKRVIDMSSVNTWSFSVKADGTYNTSGTYYHTRIFVRPGDVIRITSPESNSSQFGFLKSLIPPEGGESIDLVTGTAVTVLGAGKSEYFTAPEGAVAIAVHLGQSPYIYKPEDITVWTPKLTGGTSSTITPILATGYRLRQPMGEYPTEYAFTVPLRANYTYLATITLSSSGTLYSGITSDLPLKSEEVESYVANSVTSAIRSIKPTSDCFWTISSSKEITITVTEIAPEEESVKEGHFLDKDMENVVKATTKFSEINLSSLTLRPYLLDAQNNTYGAVDTYKHILVPVDAGKYVIIRKGTNALIYAWLTSDDAPVASSIPAYVGNTKRYYSSQEELFLRVPEGANYLYIYLYNNASAYPSYVGISTNEEDPEDEEEQEVVERGDGSANSKLFLNLERPYYFAQGWGNNDDFGYLDKMLALVPEGKHFIMFTDIHLDYANNFGLRQKQIPVMRYVQERLRNCVVVFGGDFIGQQATEIGAKKEMAWFTDQGYSMFGSRFAPALGDHDTDRVEGGLEPGEQLSEKYIADNFFGPAIKYGAIWDEKGVAAIDNVVFSDVPETNAIKKEAWKNYMKMHYYIDDKANKIRFIILTQGAAFRNIPSRYNVPGEALFFICNALQSAPSDYDIVVAAHEFQFVLRTESETTASAWDKKLFEALSAYKKHTTFVLTKPYYSYDEETNVWNAIAAEYGGTSFDFSNKFGTAFAVQGDNHYDFVGYWDYSVNCTHFAVNYTPTVNDVLLLVQDRCALNQNPGFQSSWSSHITEMLTAFRRAPASTGEVDLIGTTNEVLFDVFTLNSDGLTITRFGNSPTAGRPGLFPVFDEESTYDIDDIVVWYAMNGVQYVVKAYKFIAPHSPGEFDINEVEEVIVTDPYIRTYTL